MFTGVRTRADLSRCHKGAVGLHCQIEVIVLEESPLMVTLRPRDIEYFRVDFLPNDIRDVLVVFTQTTCHTFSVFGHIDSQPTPLTEYSQHWEFSENE
jgi:hypothetical protein